LIEECENGKEFIENPLNVKISNVGSTINTIYPDYAPVISADEEILFSLVVDQALLVVNVILLTINIMKIFSWLLKKILSGN